jgi:hypothetical protein
MRRQQLKNLIGTIAAFVVLAGVSGLVILGEHLLDITKAHAAGGGG